MRNEVAPSFLSALFVVAVVEKGGGKGAGDGEEDEPITRGELEAEIGETCSGVRRSRTAYSEWNKLPIMRKTGFWTGLGGALGEVFEVEDTDASFTASADTGFGLSAMV